VQAFRSGALLSSALALSLAISSAWAADQQAAAPKGSVKGTIGFVMTSWISAVYQTDDGKEECPSGFIQSNRDNWKSNFRPKRLGLSSPRNMFTLAPALLPDRFRQLITEPWPQRRERRL